VTTPTPQSDQAKLNAEVTADDKALAEVEAHDADVQAKDADLQKRDADLEAQDAQVQAHDKSLQEVVDGLKAQPAAGNLDFTELDAFTTRVQADAVAVAVGAPINPVNGQPATTILTTAPAAQVLDVSTGAAVIAPTQGVNPPLITAPVVDPNVPAGVVESVPVVVVDVPVQAPATEAPAPASGSAPATTDPAAPAQTPAAAPGAPAVPGASGDTPAVVQAKTDALATPTVEAPVTVVSPGSKSTYTFDGDPSTVDHTEWPDAGKRADGTPLFTFAGDTAPGDAKGVGGPWHLDTASKA
jgi:hypothetical protein